MDVVSGGGVMEEFVITQEMYEAMADLDCGNCGGKTKTLLPNGMCINCWRGSGLTSEDLCRMMHEAWGPQTWAGNQHIEWLIIQ
jgi:hypothetical protein